jgi:hypothetical protein
VTAIRTARSSEGKFTMVANGAAQDRRLTAAARGIILYVLSLPPDAHFTQEWLADQLPDGRKAVRAAMRNLEQAGYFQRTRTSDGKTWTWDQVITDAPVQNPVPMVFPQVTPSDTKVAHGVNSRFTTFPQVTPSDTIASDAMVHDKNLKTDLLKDEKNVAVEPEVRPGREAMASRRGRASRSRADLTSQDKIEGTRFAIAAAYGESWNKTISDEEALALYELKAPASGKVTSPSAYMKKIFEDTPAFDTLLSQLDNLGDDDGDHYDLAHDEQPFPPCQRCGGMRAELNTDGVCAWCVREDIINRRPANTTPRHVVPNTVTCPRCESTWTGPFTESGICGSCEGELATAKTPIPAKFFIEGYNMAGLIAVRDGLKERTGKEVSAEWAAKVFDFLTSGKTVGHPARYVKTVIAQDLDPHRFLPTPTPPNTRQLARAS